LHERLATTDSPRERYRIITRANSLYSTRGW